MHSTRLFELNDRPIRPEGSYVLYWMTSARRPYNFALEHAIEQANILGKGLIVFEGLRMDYRWASDRMHQFVLDGMKDIHNTFKILRSPIFHVLKLLLHQSKRYSGHWLSSHVWL